MVNYEVGSRWPQLSSNFIKYLFELRNNYNMRRNNKSWNFSTVFVWVKNVGGRGSWGQMSLAGKISNWTFLCEPYRYSTIIFRFPWNLSNVPVNSKRYHSPRQIFKCWPYPTVQANFLVKSRRVGLSWDLLW